MRRAELSPQQRGPSFLFTDLTDGGGGTAPDRLAPQDARGALATIYGPSKMRVDTFVKTNENTIVGQWRVTPEVCQPRNPLYDDIEILDNGLLVAHKKVIKADVVDHFREDIGYALGAVDQIGQVVDMVGFAASRRGIQGVALLVRIDSANFTGNNFGVLKLGREFETKTVMLDWDEDNRVKTHSTLTAHGQENPTTTLDLQVKIIPVPEGLFLRNEELAEALVQLGLAPEFLERPQDFPIFEEIGKTILPETPVKPDDALDLFIEFLQRKDANENERYVMKGHVMKENDRIAESQLLRGSFQPLRRAQRMLRPVE